MSDLSTEARARVEAAVECFADALCNVVREHADEPPARGSARAALLATVEAVVGEARREGWAAGIEKAATVCESRASSHFRERPVMNSRAGGEARKCASAIRQYAGGEPGSPLAPAARPSAPEVG